jgi:hypothetical protein
MQKTPLDLNFLQSTLITAKTVFLRGQLANQWTALAGQLFIIRTTLNNILNIFTFFTAVTGPQLMPELMMALKPMLNTLAEAQIILDYVSRFLAQTKEFSFDSVTAKELEDFRALNYDLKDKDFEQQKETVLALIDYCQEAQALVDLFSRELALKPSRQVFDSYTALFPPLIAKAFAHLPAWKEEALGGYFLARAREHRRAALLVATGEGEEVKCELHFLCAAIVMNDYERVLKLCTVTVAPMLRLVGLEFLRVLYYYQGKASTFPVPLPLLEEVLEFVCRLAMIADFDTKMFEKDAKDLLSYAPQDHQTLYLARLSIIGKATASILPWMLILSE